MYKTKRGLGDATFLGNIIGFHLIRQSRGSTLVTGIPFREARVGADVSDFMPSFHGSMTADHPLVCDCFDDGGRFL